MRLTGPGLAGGEELFSPITAGRISGMIVDQIRSLIRDGRLAPGDRLPSERELAEQFGVSRVTVRDALRALEAMGLVDIRVGANGGAFLQAPPSHIAGQGMADMLLMSALTPEEVAEARLMLELNTVVLAVRRATDEDLAQLRDICRRSAELLKTGEYDVHLSWDFHERLAAATHNPAIEMITRSFRGPLSLRRLRAREEVSVAHQRTVREHSELVDAIERRDMDGARAVLSAHVVRATNLDARLGSLGIPGMPLRPRADSDPSSEDRSDPSPEEQLDDPPGGPPRRLEEDEEDESLPTGPDPIGPLKRDEEHEPGLDPVVAPIPPD